MTHEIKITFDLSDAKPSDEEIDKIKGHSTRNKYYKYEKKCKPKKDKPQKKQKGTIYVETSIKFYSLKKQQEIKREITLHKQEKKYQLQCKKFEMRIKKLQDKYEAFKNNNII